MRLVLPLFAVLAALPTPAAAQVPIEFNFSREAELSPEAPRDADGAHYDAYRFEAEAGRTYAIYMLAPAFVPRLRAGPARGDDCDPCTAADLGTVSASLELRATQGGTYVIRAGAEEAGRTGAYSLRVGAMSYNPGATVTLDSAEAAAVDSVMAAARAEAARDDIAVGQEVAGALDAEDDQEVSPSGELAFSDTWQYEGRATETLTATARSGDFEPMLEVVMYDGRGDLVRLGATDGTAGGADARVRATLPDYGPVEIRVTARNGEQAGAYTLRLESDQPADAQADTMPFALYSLGPWGPATGTLGELSEVEDGRRADRLEFVGTRGQTVVLTVRARDFDPALRVIESRTGEVVGEVQAGGREARITVTLPYTTSYHLRVTSRGPGEEGPYEATLARP
jgi:hypothetical protein